MTREEAAAFMGTTPDASPDEVRKTYRSLYGDFQVRLTNAPTPALKQAYQRNLQELDEAASVLVPGFVPDPAGDLPASEPVAWTRPAPEARPRRSPVDEARSARGAISPRPGRALSIAVGVAIASAALASLGIMEWATTAGHLRSLQVRSPDNLGRGAGEGEWVRKLRNSRLEVCNAASTPIKVTWVASTYLADGKWSTYNSAKADYPTWTIAPGARRRLDHVRGEQVIWDGATYVYALAIEHSMGEFMFAGVFDERQSDGCVKVAIDR